MSYDDSVWYVLQSVYVPAQRDVFAGKKIMKGASVSYKTRLILNDLGEPIASIIEAQSPQFVDYPGPRWVLAKVSRLKIDLSFKEISD